MKQVMDTTSSAGVIMGSRRGVLSALFGRLVKDMFSPMRFVLELAILVSLPLIVCLMTSSGNLGVSSPEAVATRIMAALAFPVFFWSSGVAFAFIIGIKTSPLVAERVETHQMLVLASKPISRGNMLGTMFCASLCYGSLLNACSVFVLGFTSVLFLTGNFLHFVTLMPFLLMVIVYNLLLTAFITSISLGFSCLTSKSRNATMGIIIFLIIAYLGFTLIRAGLPDLYDTLGLYHVNFAYHWGNLFDLLLVRSGILPPFTSWQSLMALFSGVYKTAQPDTSQGFAITGMDLTGYYPAWASLLLCIVLAGGLFFIGFMKFKRRELT